MSLPNDDRVDFKCRSEDKDRWKAVASESGRSLSNWIVWALNEMAEAAEKKSK